jgi:Flp pilus assembly protein TadG
MKTNAVKRQEGFVMVMVALVLIILVGFVALGVDTGALYSARTSAQAVADAAALAGAFTFVNNPSSPQPATATNHALQVAVNNTVMGKAVVAADVTVTVDVNNDRVTVALQSQQPTYFARVFFGSTATINVTATAEAGETSPGGCCTRPWYLPNTIFSDDPICTSRCDTSQILINPTTMEVTDFGEDMIGEQLVVKPNNPENSLSPGQFYLMDLPDSSGGNDYRMNIVYGAGIDVQCLDLYSVLTGNMVGPTTQGVDSLIGDPPRFEWAGTETNPAQYRRISDSAIFDMADNVIISPIWDACTLTDFCPDAKLNGTTPTVRMIGWAVLFLEGVQGPNVEARLINVTSCGPGTSTEGGSTTLTLPLRLVRP